jgi:hypothetical protein
LARPEAEDRMENWETNWNRDVLERIVALLFALAGLADLAAGAPFHRRRLVLGILSYGEAEARAFLIGMPPAAPDPADALKSAGARRASRCVCGRWRCCCAPSSRGGPRFPAARPVRGPAGRRTGCPGRRFAGWMPGRPRRIRRSPALRRIWPGHSC